MVGLLIFMVGLQILYENPRLLEETLIPMSAAGQYFPTKPKRSTLERWIRRGVNGVKLDTVRVGVKRFTTLSAITKFLHAQQSQGPQTAVPKKTMSQAEIEAGRKRLGLPESV